MLAGLLVADFPFPLALQTYLHVLAGRLWSRFETMTLAEILATHPRFVRNDEVAVRLLATPNLDASGHVTGLEVRLGARRDEELTLGGPWVLTLPVTSSASRFTLHFVHHVESRWLDAEIRLRLGAGQRELGHLDEADLFAIRDQLSSMGNYDGGLPYCRYAWLLGQLVNWEVHLRRKIPPTSHDRMQFAHACGALRAEVATELVKAMAWSARRTSLRSPVLGGGSILPPGDARLLAEHRAARAAELAGRAMAAAKRKLRAEAGSLICQRR